MNQEAKTYRYGGNRLDGGSVFSANSTPPINETLFAFSGAPTQVKERGLKHRQSGCLWQVGIVLG